MKKRIERIFSDKCMRGMAVCLVLTVSIAFLGYVILLSLKTVIPADSFSALADIFVILITILEIAILKIIVTLSAVIMGVRLIIYGNEVKHDKIYWEVGVDTQVMETGDNPYWLPVRYNNPILPFLIGFGCYIAVACFIFINCLHFGFSRIIYIVLFLLINYGLMVAIVILTRLFRRFRAFKVKVAERIS